MRFWRWLFGLLGFMQGSSTPSPDGVPYHARASRNPRPPGWVEPEDVADHATLAAAEAVTFQADVAEFQGDYTTAYPYQTIAIRGDNGGRLDYSFAQKYHAALADPKNVLVVVYLVFTPSASAQSVIARLKTVIGPTVPRKVAFRVDMESGDQFAGPGDHTAAANAWLAALDAWAGRGSLVSEDGYANAYDWASNWPGRPSSLKRVTASYGGSDPGTHGWQYYGGLDYPTPAGWPRGCPPFGAWCDMNAFHMTAAALAAAYGAGAPVPPTPTQEDDDVTELHLDGANKGQSAFFLSGGKVMVSLVNADRLNHIHAGKPTFTWSTEGEFRRAMQSWGGTAALAEHDAATLPEVHPELEALCASAAA